MKKIFLLTILTTTLFYSCKKDGDTPGPQPQGPPPQIATIKQTIEGGQPFDLTKEFVYDAASRLKEIKYSGASTADVIEKYTYNGSQVQYRHYVGSVESVSASLDYTLNGDGRADKSVSTYYNSANLHEYNSAGYISRINFVSNGNGTGYNLFYYSAGNRLDSLTSYSASGNKNYVHVFTYETGKRNTIGGENKGLTILGNDQVAPVRKRTLFVYDLPGWIGVRLKYYELDYTYEYDNAGRIKKHTVAQTQYSHPGGSSQNFIREAMEYTYKQ